MSQEERKWLTKHLTEKKKSDEVIILDGLEDCTYIENLDEEPHPGSLFYVQHCRNKLFYLIHVGGKDRRIRRINFKNVQCIHRNKGDKELIVQYNAKRNYEKFLIVRDPEIPLSFLNKIRRSVKLDPEINLIKGAELVLDHENSQPKQTISKRMSFHASNQAYDKNTMKLHLNSSEEQRSRANSQPQPKPYCYSPERSQEYIPAVRGHTKSYEDEEPQKSIYIDSAMPPSKDAFFYKDQLTGERFLSKGGQAHVVVATMKDTNRQVAVKYFSHVSRIKGDCARELRLLKKSSHKNIVTFYGILYESLSVSYNHSALGFLMEYMEGGSLQEVIYKKNDTLYDGNTVLDWIDQVASGLEFLHEQEIIHRDIKPANLLLDKKLKTVKICDLGISTQDPFSATECGTIYYTAPELFGDKKEKIVTNKCDVYSLGITLWEVCHRKPPYGKIHFLDLLLSIRDENLRPVIDTDHCIKALADLMKSMWEADVSKRIDATKVRKEILRIKYQN